MSKPVIKWTLQHENETQTQVEPKDSRGLRLARDSGFRWVNRNDGSGWRRIGDAIASAEFAEFAKAVAK